MRSFQRGGGHVGIEDQSHRAEGDQVLLQAEGECEFLGVVADSSQPGPQLEGPEVLEAQGILQVPRLAKIGLRGRRQV